MANDIKKRRRRRACLGSSLGMMEKWEAVLDPIFLIALVFKKTGLHEP